MEDRRGMVGRIVVTPASESWPHRRPLPIPITPLSTNNNNAAPKEMLRSALL